MASEQTLNIEQRPMLRLSVQQLRFVKMLEYNAQELEEAVDRELEENPALEIADKEENTVKDTPSYLSSRSGAYHDDSQIFDFSPPDTGESLLEVLLRQLSEKTLPEKEHLAARYIIGNIDSNGYLRRPLQGIVNDMAFGPGIEVSLRDAEEALKVVQEFEPYGVGATDLRECLLIQLQHLQPSGKRDDAIRIIESQYEAFTMKHTHRLISGLKLSRERVKEALDLILTLNPKPGASFNNDNDHSNIIVPDLFVTNEDGEINVSTNNRIPDLAIDRSFSEAIAEMEQGAKRKKKKGSEFITGCYNDARDFIRILKQRQETLMSVMTAIVKIQKEYFLTQDIYTLKPMIIKDISALTGLDLSVVSRATANKFVGTPWGVFPLRFFFSDSIGDENDDSKEVLTNRKIEAEIAALVEKEDKKHPLSDERIKQEIEARGYEVSRRTVAKYRDRQGIPVARLRKEL